MRTADTASKVDANHDGEAPSPRLGLEVTSSILGSSNGEINT